MCRCHEVGLNHYAWLMTCMIQVFQRRLNGVVDFYRNWKNYSDGFGDLATEFYLGEQHYVQALSISKHVSTFECSVNGQYFVAQRLLYFTKSDGVLEEPRTRSRTRFFKILRWHTEILNMHGLVRSKLISRRKTRIHAESFRKIAVNDFFTL